MKIIYTIHKKPKKVGDYAVIIKERLETNPSGNNGVGTSKVGDIFLIHEIQKSMYPEIDRWVMNKKRTHELSINLVRVATKQERFDYENKLQNKAISS